MYKPRSLFRALCVAALALFAMPSAFAQDVGDLVVAKLTEALPSADKPVLQDEQTVVHYQNMLVDANTVKFEAVALETKVDHSGAIEVRSKALKRSSDLAYLNADYSLLTPLKLFESETLPQVTQAAYKDPRLRNLSWQSLNENTIA